jgi:hypothetical protein
MGIAQVARWAIQRRRGQYIWLVVCACIAVGALPRLLLSLLSLVGQVANPAGATHFAGGLLGLLWTIVYVVAATGAAYARLRPGRQV